ncbi:TIM barrel protein [Psychromarinibacter sp. C21-152]|uniref:TIM barrel protein n=1 Tax=Psychromarinibacter sediminicola TaxID=3033385 RepID=A0AAE3NXK8_9RHOB|nr:TIM barrel protein [Psychromarinibacter sediminicola]MDF0603956.1 TIM barrel protein [Psychromarinibacter sediminicola]
MGDLPVVGAQFTALLLDRHRDWLFDKHRDLELPEYAMADILRAPEPFIDMARKRLDGWHGRLGVHGPFSGFEIDTTDRDVRAVVQARLDACLDACAGLGAVQMVLHSPFDSWDAANFVGHPRALEKRIGAILDTLGPALRRAADQGVTLVLENIKDVDPAARAAVVAAADSPALRLSVDTGHANWAHTACGAPSPAGFVAAAGESLAHVHLQDTDGTRDAHWALGDGNIDFAAVFAELGKLDARPHLIVEINDFSQVPQSVAHLEALGLAQ